MRVLITGIKGAAGSYLAEHLREQGKEVVGISRPECNLLDFEAVRFRLMAQRPGVIYHMAADADVRGSFDSAAQCFGNNTLGTINLFEAVRLLKLETIVVMCSTSEVYGTPDHYPIGEEWPFAPMNPYAVSKAAQDLLAQMYARTYGMNVVITRAFGYVNPRRDNLSLSSFARQIVAIERGRQQYLLHGNLASVRTFCHVRDMVRAYEMAWALPTVSLHNRIDGIYNIGSTEPVSIGACLQAMIEMAKVPIPTRLADERIRPADITNAVPNVMRFTAHTGWKPQIPLRDSLRWLLDHYRALAPEAVAA